MFVRTFVRVHSPQRFRFRAVARLALRPVGARTAGQAAVRRIVAGRMAGSVAADGRTLQLLRVRGQHVMMAVHVALGRGSVGR